MKFISEIFPGWSLDNNYGFSDLGKIIVLWHPSATVNTIFKSLQMITCEVSWPHCQDGIIISVIYGSNSAEERTELWAELAHLGSNPAVQAKPWLVMGDFNQTLDPSEHSKSTSFNIDKRTRDFRDCLLEAEIEDLNFRGNTFTWWNKRKSDPVAKKLDRVLVNNQWLVNFPYSLAVFGSQDFSDHAVASINLSPTAVEAKRPFKFYNYLLRNESFLPMVQDRWYSFNIIGSGMFIVSKKLKMLKRDIREFAKHNYSDLEKRTKEAHETLLILQDSMLADPTPFNADRELQAQLKWEELSKAEEEFYLQRSRVQWLG